MNEMLVRIMSKQLILPPGGLLLLALFGVLLLRCWPRLGRLFVVTGTLGLWLMCTPWGSHVLYGLLDTEAPLPRASWQQLDAGAIVVLGAGRTGMDAGWQGDQPGALAFERLRMAARIQRASGLPLMVSGGSPRGESRSEAEISRDVLQEDLQVPLRWAEGESRTTWENAFYSARLLREAGISKVVLVTHAWHMPRARWCFEQQGLQVTAAPFGYDQGSRSLLPDGQSLWLNGLLVNELAGRWMYQRQYGTQ